MVEDAPADDPGTGRPRRPPEGLRGTQVALGLGVLAVAAGLMVAVGLAISEGFAGLTEHGGSWSDGSGWSDSGEPLSARAVGSDVLVLTLLSGIVAAAITEFLKRMVRLRQQFNRAAVRGFLGRLSAFDWTVGGPGGVPLVAVPPTYGAPLSQLCAQLGQSLSLLATGLAEGRLTAEKRDQALDVLFDSAEATAEIRKVLPEKASDARFAEPAPTSPLTAALLLQAERQLDAFQLRTRAQWHRMLQWISAGVAAGFMLCVGLAVEARPVSILVGCLLGLVIGGPVAWTVRDVVRLVERRAG